MTFAVEILVFRCGVTMTLSCFFTSSEGSSNSVEQFLTLRFRSTLCAQFFAGRMLALALRRDPGSSTLVRASGMVAHQRLVVVTLFRMARQTQLAHSREVAVDADVGSMMNLMIVHQALLHRIQPDPITPIERAAERLVFLFVRTP